MLPWHHCGVMTTRSQRKAFLKMDHRANFRFTLINQLFTDLEGVKRKYRHMPDRVSGCHRTQVVIAALITATPGVDALWQILWSKLCYYISITTLNNAQTEIMAGSIPRKRANKTLIRSRVQEKYRIIHKTFPCGLWRKRNWNNYCGG